LHTKNEAQSVIRTWREKRVGAPSLTAAKPRLSVADSSPGMGTGRGGTKLHASVAGSRVTAFLATAAPWEPYFTDHPRRRSKWVDNIKMDV
jgi:hypothetical protein